MLKVIYNYMSNPQKSIIAKEKYQVSAFQRRKQCKLLSPSPGPVSITNIKNIAQERRKIDKYSQVKIF